MRTSRLSCFLATVVSPALAGAPPEMQPPTHGGGRQGLAPFGDISPIHDPAIIRQRGTYHLFASNRFAEKLVPMFCSTDRRRWALCGNVFDAVPAWALQEVPGARGIWARTSRSSGAGNICITPCPPSERTGR